MQKPLTEEQIDKLSDMELVAMFMRQQLKKGTITPDVEPVKAVEKKTPKTEEINWKTVPKECPKCGKHGFIDPDFGVRVVRGKTLKQSWCNECRATTNYYSKKRKYEKR